MANKAVGPELHQGLVNTVKQTPVEDVDRLPDLLRAFVRARPFALKLLASGFLDLQEELHGDNRVLRGIQRRFEVLVVAQFGLLHELELLNGRPEDGLCQPLQKLDMVVVCRLHSVVKRGCLTNVGNLELQQVVQQFVCVRIRAVQDLLDQVALAQFNPLFLLLSLNRLGILEVDVAQMLAWGRQVNGHRGTRIFSFLEAETFLDK